MSHKQQTRFAGRIRESGISLVLSTLSLVVIVPMMGLVVDTGVLFAVRTRLQASVDGAALGAARALNLGQTTAAQSDSAKQNAVNWFYANFPAGNWGTSGTVMSTTSVDVFDDANNPNLRNVRVTASTQVSTYFMRYFNTNAVTVSAIGNASRRDVVAVLVLDRSLSMCAPSTSVCNGNSGTSPCAMMVKAAKSFAGQFAAGRDRIGLVSYSDNIYIHSAPSTNFQTTLGYTNASGSGTGELDTIRCGGGTGTAAGMAAGFYLLQQTNLPGALNAVILETDGLPNTLTMNFWDSGNTVAGISNSSTCRDRNNKTKSGGGFDNLASLPAWSPGLTLTSSPFLTNSPSQALFANINGTNNLVGTISTENPGGSNRFWYMENYWSSNTANSQSTGSTSYPYNSVTGSSTPSMRTSTQAPSCGFVGSNAYGVNSVSDVSWYPAADVFGNRLNPSNFTYKTVTVDGQGHANNSGWTNYINAVANATADSAYRIRTHAVLPSMIFAIGLGGNSTTGPPDPVLMQRMANDPDGDTFNATPYYLPCAQASNCQTFANQPQGKFIYSPNANSLGEAFLGIASQVLRLSQ